MLTEEGATKKWCPFVRAVNGTLAGGVASHRSDQPSYNRVVEDANWTTPKGAACIGSMCMAWRTVEKDDHILLEEIGFERAKKLAGGFPYVIDMSKERYGRMVFTPLGYCGLAGKPNQ